MASSAGDRGEALKFKYQAMIMSCAAWLWLLPASWGGNMVTVKCGETVEQKVERQY